MPSTAISHDTTLYTDLGLLVASLSFGGSRATRGLGRGCMDSGGGPSPFDPLPSSWPAFFSFAEEDLVSPDLGLAAGKSKE